ncbi:phage tail tube protein [Yinghuangia soli]|uniref:IPT/TIG domain-containing protein n=1 Tax=Yinghuangia soli TaxID=2908204 RepID=A0AA41U3F3_9ACTN|nr:IPT/TIG domain-containing protein [Yinghuangia soli]MCF2531751.1 IPT/TIG domain-containing protein [Yinghuangia soli]
MALTITGAVPNTGSEDGGTLVQITGTDLNTVTGVTIGGEAAQFEIIAPTLIHAIAPAHAVGAVNIVVTNGSTPQTLTAGFTYTASTIDDEELVATLAREWAIDFNMAAAGVTPKDYLSVRAVRNMVPKVTPTMQDDSDYENEGWTSQAKTMLGWEITLTISRKVGRVSGQYPRSVERLRACATQFGGDGLADVRWYKRRPGDEAYQGVAHVNWDPQGGEAANLDEVQCILTGNGKRTEIMNPTV